MKKIRGQIAAFLDTRTIVVNKGARENITLDHVCFIEREGKVYFFLVAEEVKEKMSIYKIVWSSKDTHLFHYVEGPLKIGYPVTLGLLDDQQEGLFNKAVLDAIAIDKRVIEKMRRMR